MRKTDDPARILLDSDIYRPGDTLLTDEGVELTIMSLPTRVGRGYEYLATERKASKWVVWLKEFWADLWPVLYHGSGGLVLGGWCIMMALALFHRELAGGANKVEIILDLVAWTFAAWMHPVSRRPMRVLFGFEKWPWQKRT